MQVTNELYLDLSVGSRLHAVMGVVPAVYMLLHEHCKEPMVMMIIKTCLHLSWEISDVRCSVGVEIDCKHDDRLCWLRTTVTCEKESCM